MTCVPDFMARDQPSKVEKAQPEDLADRVRVLASVTSFTGM